MTNQSIDAEAPTKFKIDECVALIYLMEIFFTAI